MPEQCFTAEEHAIIMPTYRPINTNEFSGKFWRRYPNYSFTLSDAICPLSITELAKATMAMPIGFIQKDESYSLVALQGIAPESNLFVSLQGKWLGQYVPEIYQYYPFKLIVGDKNIAHLNIDIDSQVISEKSEEGNEPFFKDNGELNPSLLKVEQSLKTLHAGFLHTAKLCHELKQMDLIEPWKLKIQLGNNSSRTLTGLFKVSDDAFTELSSENLKTLQSSGALLLCYCQKLSRLHLNQLSQLAAFRESDSSSAFILDSESKSESLNFDNI